MEKKQAYSKKERVSVKIKFRKETAIFFWLETDSAPLLAVGYIHEY